MAETRYRFIATNIGAFVDIGSVFDEGLPGSRRVTTCLIDGDIRDAWQSAIEAMQYVGTNEGMASLVQKMIKWGLIEIAKDALPFKKSWTFGKFTFGI